MTELAHGAAVAGAIHAMREPHARTSTVLRSGRLDALLGAPVAFPEALGILERLGFETQLRGDAGTADVTIPTHRPDVSREEDLIEEVARVRGLDAIPTVLPAIRPQPPRATGLLERRVREVAVALGLSEAVTYGFVSPAALATLGAPASPLRLANPITEERSVMRTSLVPGLLEVVQRAMRRGQSEARLFTIGALFGAGEGPLPDERPSFCAVLSGMRHPYLAKAEPFDVYDAKGVAVEIVERVTGRAAEAVLQPQADRAPHLHPRGAANLLVGDVLVGSFGPLHPNALSAWDLSTAGAVVVELDLRALERLGQAAHRYAPIPRLPAATRDIALVVHDDVSSGQIQKLIREAAGDLCERVELFDVFRGGSVPPDHRSLAFHVVYRDPRAATAPSDARTLTDQEVDTRHAAAVSKARAELGALLRT